MRIPLEDQITMVAKIKEKVNTAQGGRVIYVTISGSDLYGFASPDSDVDYRGCYQTATGNLLGLTRKKDVIEMKPDIVMFELAKEINLALDGNCNVLEHLNSKPIYRTAESVELTQMINNNFAKRGLYNSYRGMALFNYRKFILQGKKTYKKYLYIFRGLLAGIHALETGRIQPNINELNQYFKIKEVKQLVQNKVEKTENAEITEMVDSGHLDSLIPPLFERMDRSYLRSQIQETTSPEGLVEINQWLIELRRNFNS